MILSGGRVDRGLLDEFKSAETGNSTARLISISR